MSYYFAKSTNYSFEDTVTRVTEELKKEGFGVLTEIDVKETLRKKLEIDFRRYKILGACNPPFAHQALQAEEHIGLLLPCNVVVQEKEKAVEVSFLDPLVAMASVPGDKLEHVATQVRDKLRRVMENL